MEYIKKEEIEKLLDAGAILIQTKYPDFGTTSMFRPIKKGRKPISKFSIENKPVNATTGRSLITKLKAIKAYRSGLCDVVEWKKEIL